MCCRKQGYKLPTELPEEDRQKKSTLEPPLTFREKLFVHSILLVYVIIFSLGYYVVVFLVLLQVNRDESVICRVLLIIVGTAILLLTVWNLLYVVFAKVPSPTAKYHVTVADSIRLEELLGEASDQSKAEAQVVLEDFVKSQQLVLYQREHKTMGIRYCRACKCVKPDRSHHCWICGRCMLRMDHHCPFVASCVHFGNYKAFCLFLFYASALCWWGVAVALPTLIRSVGEGPLKFAESHDVHLWQLIAMYIIAVPAIYSSLSLPFFSGIFVVRAIRNRFSLEAIYKPVFKPVSEEEEAVNFGADSCLTYTWRSGNKWKDFCDVFGDVFWRWFIPNLSSRGDGCEFIPRVVEIPQVKPQTTENSQVKQNP